MKDHKNDPPVHNVLKQVATTPDRSSYIWKDGQPSILSIGLLWFVWICRLFSLLQWCKFFIRLGSYIKQRRLAKARAAGESEQKITILDKGARRRNIPPWFPELYFLIWLIIMAAFYFIGLNNLVIKIITYYYLFESIVWVAYYTIFRRFFEEKYSLYHTLENLVILILLFATQMFAFTNILRDVPDIENSLFQNLLGLLGAGWDKTYPLVKLCGAFNAAIVIATIINSFPNERTKSDIDDEQFFIIGNGDVVQQRVYPALEKAKFKDKYIEIYDLPGGKDSGKHAARYLSQDKIVLDIKKRVNSRTVIFLCSPSFAHYEYIDELYHLNYKLFVVEKPIETNIDHLLDIQKSIIEKPDLRNKFFFLSYYCLEKALPLTYLIQRNEAYLKYLSISDTNLLNKALDELGELKSVDVVIKEEQEKREWSKDPSFGGQLTETFIHNVLIATMLVGEPKNWAFKPQDLKISSAYEKIELKAKAGNVPVHLLQSKMDGVKERYASIKYQNGTINVDFESESLVIKFNNGQELTIRIKDSYLGKYAVQIDLIRRVYDGELDAKDVDGLGQQVETIAWLLKINADYIAKNKK